MITYKISCGKYEANSFGISAFDNEMPVKNFADITDSRNDAEKLVSLCNEMQIELCHIDDIIEDYLTDFYI